MRAFSSDPTAVEAVARALAGVIAKKVVADDRKLARLDGLGKAMAVSTLVGNMAASLTEEAKAALDAAQALFAAEVAP